MSFLCFACNIMLKDVHKVGQPEQKINLLDEYYCFVH